MDDVADAQTFVLTSLAPLVNRLRADGYTVVAPTVKDAAIVLDELSGADQLPHGWGVRTGPGRYKLQRRDDRAAFAHSVGPQGWKRFLHPPREPLFSVRADGDQLTFTSAEQPNVEQAKVRYAFVGVRPCDLRAIAVQDRVLGASRAYAERRRDLFLVAVNCTEPSDTCFCVSAGGGPRARSGYDLVLTELVEPAPIQPRYLVGAGSAAGATILADLAHIDADAATVARADAQLTAATTRMTRSLPDVDLRAMLARTLESPRWDDVAKRCLACGNCTMACPTCFCTSVSDTTDLTGDHAERTQHWASCYEVDFSYLHGGSVRPSIRSRYRQWLTHKLGTWHDQFGESGCVGCGRCIAWCPVGIDITVEAHALATSEAAP